MPKQFSSKARESALGKVFDDVMQAAESGGKLPYETDFMESPSGLQMKLRPVQRVIAKAIFGVPMDYKQTSFVVWDKMKQNKVGTFTDTSYLKWVHEQGRCNFGDWRDLPSRGFYRTALFVGRRAGKSVLVSAVVACMLRNLLAISSPQQRFNLINNSNIDLTMMGTDEESSGNLYRAVQTLVNNSPYYTNFLRSSGEKEMTFVTQSDRGSTDVLPSIKVVSKPCTTRSVRGPNNFVLALDEYAFFRSTKDTDSDEMYNAAIHSTSMFPNPEDPEVADSKVLMISSPAKKLGKMYEVYAEAMADGINSNTFVYRASTAEMNPIIPASYLAAQQKEDPIKFEAELGGEFLDASGSYVPKDTFMMCVADGEDGRPLRENQTRLNYSGFGRKYFWWIDYGTKKDATGVAIGHLEIVQGKGVQLIFDYVDRMMVGETFSDPGIPPREDGIPRKFGTDVAELNPDDVIAWLEYMNSILPCFRGGTDQHGGGLLKYNLSLHGMTSIEVVHLTPEKNSKLASALKGFLEQGAASFPNVPHFIEEFKNLEADYVNKYTLRVAAPEEKGAHDDMADAAQGVAWLAKTWLDEDDKLGKDPSGSFLLPETVFTNPAPITDYNAVTLMELKLASRQGGLSMDSVPPQYAAAIMDGMRFRRRF